jgi:hypothetical protein
MKKKIEGNKVPPIEVADEKTWQLILEYRKRGIAEYLAKDSAHK